MWSTLVKRGRRRLVVQRNRQLNRTRRAIAEAALELFEREGVDAVTVDRIAEMAEVSRPTFYRHFTSKEDTVFASEADDLRTLEATLDAAEADLGGEGSSAFDIVLNVAKEAMLERATDRRYWLRRYRLLASEPTLLNRSRAGDALIEDLFAPRLAQDLGGGAVAEAQARALAAGWMAGVFHALVGWAQSDGAIDPTETIEGVDRAIRCGLERLIAEREPAPRAARRPATTSA
jgi:AcrR family transcriptional regulator